MADVAAVEFEDKYSNPVIQNGGDVGTGVGGSVVGTGVGTGVGAGVGAGLGCGVKSGLGGNENSGSVQNLARVTSPSV
jgi:hypothetical protein